MNENKLYDNFFHKIILVQKVNEMRYIWWVIEWLGLSG